MYTVPYLFTVPACLWVEGKSKYICVYVSSDGFFVHFHVCLFCVSLLWEWSLRKCGLSEEFVYR